MSNKVIILGCGGSSGVPTMWHSPDGMWGDCDPVEPRNRRTRSSIYIEYNNSRILVDASPDLRHQYLANKLTGIDAVILTHEHSDHVSGIHDLRAIFIAQGKKPIPVYATEKTFVGVRGTYDYLFKLQSPQTIYPQVLQQNIVQDNFTINGNNIHVFDQPHGDTTSLGIRIDNFAYSTDFNKLTDDLLDKLHNLDLWIVDCVSIDRNLPTHSNLYQTMEYVALLKPKKTILTHMGWFIDYNKVKKLLPSDGSVEPAYDGMTITF